MHCTARLEEMLNQYSHEMQSKVLEETKAIGLPNFFLELLSLHYCKKPQRISLDKDSGKQREDVYEQDIQQQEGKGLNRGTPEHLAISDV
ncbi:hypothetical protein BUALT_Bualt10G0050300 [Buddleja alternifolia]|uniref:Uncharacterized protein n=1 Tax=Buddleja alternifolia TaxID=168488 RepID=A0AAV6X739_9LAMI|nr:hypothetical protein BUALT_Bualt10G0050300 [Buddleja alternifolia]